MDHDDDVAALLDRQPVTGLLVAAVPQVLLVDVDGHLVESASDLDRVVAAVVVDDDDLVDVVLRDHFRVGALERRRGVVRRHHDDDLLVLVHPHSPRPSGPERAGSIQPLPGPLFASLLPLLNR